MQRQWARVCLEVRRTESVPVRFRDDSDDVEGIVGCRHRLEPTKGIVACDCSCGAMRSACSASMLTPARRIALSHRVRSRRCRTQPPSHNPQCAISHTLAARTVKV